MSSWFQCVLTIAGFLFIAIGGLLLSRRYVTRRLVFSRDINDAVNYFGSAMAALYSVTLGLIAVASWQNYSDVDNLVSHEASTIGVIYRDVGGYPKEIRDEFRRRLREYTVFVIEKSWPAQRQGILLDQATMMITDLHQIMLDYEPPTIGRSVMHAEAMRKFNELIDLRRQRADKVDQGLPLVLWIVVAVGGILTLGVSYFFWIEDVRFHVLLLTLLTVFVALMIYLIASLDRPFRGNISVPPDSYRLIIERVMNPIDAAGKKF